LSVAAFDPDSNIASVAFFVGRPADNQVPTAATLTQASPAPGRSGVWTAQVPIPPGTPSPMDVSAQVVNGAGLDRFVTLSVELVDGDVEAPGQIAGQVLEGPLGQPSLTVTLNDASAKPGEGKGPVATVVTDATGNYLFENVKPGQYVVQSSKPASNRSGEAKVTVVSGQMAQANIELALPPPPSPTAPAAAAPAAN
jgi:hypothetical protein